MTPPQIATPIGDAFRSSRGLAWGLSALALALMAWDMELSKTMAVYDLGLRALPIGVAGLAYLLVARRDVASLGLRLRPLRGWLYWAKVAVGLGIITLAFICLADAALAPFDIDILAPPTMRPTVTREELIHAVVLAPLLEEGLYRFMLCTPLAVSLGSWGTVAVSGVAFAGLHFLYGNPAPTNFIAGFLFAWAYLASGSLAVPVLLHALGNLFVPVLNFLLWKLG